MPEVGSGWGPGPGRRAKNPRNGRLPAKGKRRLYRKDPNRGVHHGVPGIVCEAWKPSPETGGSPTTPGANQGTNQGADQETDGGHSDGNKPALFEHPGSLRKKTSVRTLLGWSQTQYPSAMSKPWKNSGYKKIEHFNDIWGGFKMNLALATIKSFQVFLDGPVGG